MDILTPRRLAGLALVGLLVIAGAAQAQVNLLWYKEIAHDGRIYAFNNPNDFKAWEGSRELGKSITKVNYGPNGETVVFDSDAAMDLYNFKHGIDPEVRAYEAPKPPKPVPPTTLKIGDGELKFGGLLQGWYVMDDSEAGSGSSQLGNPTGVNTFRLRRAEIKLSGKVTKDWGFEVMIDPTKSPSVTSGADGKILQDFAISWTGLAGHDLQLGQKKIWLMEEGNRSSSALDFAERSLAARTFSDKRELGLFWKADWSPMVTTGVSMTQGTTLNNNDNNDALNFNARLDVKPSKGLVVGASGGYSAGEGTAHLGRERFAAHVRWEGTEELPLGVRLEYVEGRDESASDGVVTKLKRNGWYGTVLYTFAKKFQVGLRYEQLDRNKDSATDNKIKILTGGLHYFIKGNNANLKLNVESIEDDGRSVGGALDEKYLQAVLAAQVSF
jgi:hypothetical protein